ncbi:MMPL family transporter [Roseateles sp. NT4]|uniref:MMPL family transporter n=1 Tax=Roseateles sp. NT4 TaxID=3453715 RepID=UPI003EEB896B
MVDRPSRLAPWAWALALLLMAAGLALAAWSGRVRINTDVLAMLPKDERRPEVEQAFAALAKAGEGRVIVMLRAPKSSEAAMDRFITKLQAEAPGLKVRHHVSDAQQADWLKFFAPQRGSLLTDAQRRSLQNDSSEALAQQALTSLMQPMGLPRVGRWIDDPFNTLGAWLAERAQASKVRALDGRLKLADDKGDWMLGLIDSGASAFALSDNERIANALAAARAAVPEAQVLAAGVPLHAHAAATQAQREMHLIGVGSLVGVFALSWFAFARIRPRLLVLLSVGSGLLVAVAATLAVFGELHLITLVFGASLVGVAENYASSHYSSRIAQPPAQRFALMREQLPTMALALSTTLAGYALLATTPFPGLQQVALFSAAGLTAAFITTCLWFPHLDAGAVPERPLTRALGRAWQRWPQLSWRTGLIGALVIAVLLATAAWRGRANDDIRLLQNTPPALLQEQIDIGRRLDLPSPAQFYLLSAGSEAVLLEREEALKAKLANTPGVAGWQAVSDWVPSPARQASDAALVQRRWAEVSLLVAEQLGQPLPQREATTAPALTVEAWHAAPVSETARHQWLGRDAGGNWHSVLMLRGVSRESLPQLAALADGTTVRWVDKVADVSELLARQRIRMLGVLAIAIGAVAALLAWRLGAAWWRALVPTLIAGSLSLAATALLGQPWQLFHVLALLLLLGVGVDYGIFLLAQPHRNDLRGFVSITLAAASTWLSFGLLALSGTPALRAFGLTLGLGIALAWLLTPFFITHHDSRKD